MELERVRRATDEEWDRIWASSPYATYFHSRPWAELWAAYSEGDLRPHALLFDLADGSRVLLPASRRHNRFGRSRWVSSPQGTYGGWIAEGEVSEGQAAAVVGWLRGRPATIRQNPFDPSHAAGPSRQLWDCSDFTQVVRLERTLEEIEAEMEEHKVDQKVRQARREGLTATRSRDREHLDDYARIYRKCRAEWGDEATNDYRPELFRQFDLESRWIDFWVVRSADGQVVAAAPLLKSGSFHVVSWLTLADPDHLSLNPYDFLYHGLIRHYHERGVRCFDFNPSGGHQGVVDFKAKFATEKLRTDVRDRKTLLGKLGRAARAAAGLLGD